RSISGGVLGSLVLGAVGFLLGFVFSLFVHTVSQTASIVLAGPIVAAICGIIIGWLLGSIFWTHAPVEEGYVRQEPLDMAALCLLVDAGNGAHEARQILQRKGARYVPPPDEEPEGFEPGAPRAVTG